MPSPTTAARAMPREDREPYHFADWKAGKPLPQGWDCADAIEDGWVAENLEVFMRATVRPWVPHSTPTVPAKVAATNQEQRRAKRKIFVVKSEIHRAVEQAIEVLSETPEAVVFARADELVRPVVHRNQRQTLSLSKKGENVQRADGAVVVTPLSEAALVEVLTRYASFFKWNARTSEYVPCDCPPEVAKMILARRGHNWTVPLLRGVINAPTLRHDGTVITEPGYDDATGLFLAGDGLWRQIDEKPTRRQATDALKVLSEPISGLPFVADSDRAAALALLMTAILRPNLSTAPMFAVTAPSAGTGKSLTVDVAAIMATGRRAAVVTPTPDEAELEKRIGACALAGDQIISLDNITSILRSDQLCQMLTAEEVNVRVLGASKTVRIPSTGLICATGNNLTVYGDLNRRTIFIRLDAECERPEERRFKFDALELAIQKRPELVAAVLTIARAYIIAGAPGRASPMGSFEDWSEIIRSSLLWLGCADCRGDVDAQRAADPEKDELAEILEALSSEFAGTFTVKNVADKATAMNTDKTAANSELREALASFVERSGIFASKRFGRYLKRYTGTRIAGRWIEQDKRDNSNSTVWKVAGNDAGQQAATEVKEPVAW